LAIAWAGLLVVMGIVVLTWTTRLTYSGDRFIDRYDMEWARDAYRVASHEKFPVRELQTQSTQINPNLLAMIRRYGRPQFGP